MSQTATPGAPGSAASTLAALAHKMTDRPDLPFCTPGVAVVVRQADGSGHALYVGVDGAGRPLGADTLFPIASTSKLALGLAFLRLHGEGLVGFDDPLARHLPRAAAAARADVTLRALLCHTSGLPLDLAPEAAPYSAALAWPEIGAACLRTAPRAAPWESVQYSNVAYGLLALVLEHVTGRDFKALLDETVFAPLGVEAYIGRDLPRPPATVVDVDSAHVGTDVEPYNSPTWFRLGTPWAGIYSTADGLLTMLEAYTGRRPDLVPDATLAEVRADQTRGLGGGFATTDPFLGFKGSRRIAWPRCPWGLVVELRGDKRPHWTPATASPQSFGQIGASGCVAWHDPARRVSWAVLAPRTTDNGWLLRYGPGFGAAALDGAQAAA